MIIIGEKLNSSIPNTLQLLNSGNADAVTELIMSQSRADFVDINTALCSNETDMLEWTASLAEKCGAHGIMLDSPDPNVILLTAKKIKIPLILNSVTLTERMAELAPLAAELKCGIAVLPTNGKCVPNNAYERIKNAVHALDILHGYGINDENIYIDAAAESIASAEENAPAMVMLDTIRGIKNECGTVKTMCGLSNVSFGLPKRAVINAAMLSMAIYSGLDAAICDAASPSLLSAIHASEALCGMDEYCLQYIKYMRETTIK